MKIKLRKFFKILTICYFLFSICLLTSVSATTYDFVGVTQAGGPHDAYACDVDVFPFAGNAANRNDPVLEASDAQYTAISTSNDSRWTTVDPGLGDEIFMWFEMNNITENPATEIGRIDFSLEGYLNNQNSDFKIYVMKAGADWTQDASWVQIGATNITTGSDSTITFSLTSNFSTYIDGTGKLIWGVYETVSSEMLNIDYAKVDVLPPPDLTLTASDISFSNDNPPPGGVITISATIKNNNGDYSHLYQNWDANTGAIASASYVIYSGEFLAQSFTPSSNIKLSRVGLYISAAGTCGTLTVKIVNDDGTGKPSNNGADILATATPIDSGPYSKAWVNFDFTNPPVLNNATTYWIVCEGTGANNLNCWGWQEDESAGTNFPGGNGAYNAGSGAPWTADPATSDYWFRSYKGTFVAFYDGDPDSGGIFISTACISTPIPASGYEIVSATWTYPGGSHDIYVKIDPNNYIPESNELNNKAFKNIASETIPPNAIPDLTGQTGTEEGEIILTWTAPGDDGTTGNNLDTAYYIVRYATFSCQNVVSTTTWWNHVNVSTHTQTWPVAVQGSAEQHDVTGLTPGTTYYFALKTVDKCLNMSAIDDNADQEITQAQAWASISSGVPPAAITDLFALTGSAFGSINLTWTAPGDDGASGGNCAGYEVRYSTSAQITSANYNSATIYTGASSWTPVNVGTTENRTVCGLTPGQAYWIAIKAYDNSSNYASWSSASYSGDENKATAKSGGYIYYVNSNAPNNSGVPNGDPNTLEDCWKTIGQAFSDIRTNESNNLTGKGNFFIQIQNSAVYGEGVLLNNLTTTTNDRLTIRAATGERPTWDNSTSTVLFSSADPPKESFGALAISIPFVIIEGINFTGTEEHGILLSSTNITVRNCIFHDLTVMQGNYNHNSCAIWGTNSGCEIYNNTFYNVIYCIRITGNTFILRNNIFIINDCSSTQEIGFLRSDDFVNNSPDSNYNFFQIASVNLLARDWGFSPATPVDYTDLTDWKTNCPISPAPDQNSLEGDPKFVNPGTDFHLKSTNGHWTSSGWVNDAESSPCIDNGESYNASLEYSFYQNEPASNGNRVNMGAYANTYQASRSGTPVISISIDSSSYNFGTVLKNSTSVAVSSITVTNDGNIAERYLLNLTAPAGWTAVTDTTPGVEQFRMCGNFQTATAQSTHFGSYDAIGTTQKVCSNVNFAKDNEGEAAKGYNVTATQKRYLWFRFEAPTSTTLTIEQTITVTITAEQQP